VMTTVAFDKKRDTGLVAKDASHLFPPSTVYLSLRAKSYLRHYTYDFIQFFAPALTREIVEASL
jgi:LysR family cys regulon transcriptional activator